MLKDRERVSGLGQPAALSRRTEILSGKEVGVLAGLHCSVIKKYAGRKIAIYGLGTETEKILAEYAQFFEIAGLLDGYRTQGMLYGMPVISLEQAVRENVELILVAARPGSCKAIAKRIGKICQRNQIALTDVRGRDLCGEHRAVSDFGKHHGITRSSLLKKMEQYDVISFDLFDTLVMRRTLFVTDIFALMDHKLRQNGLAISDFQQKRISCEKELAGCAPDLIRIYEYMAEQYGTGELSPFWAARCEQELDFELVVPRTDVCALLETMRQKGKEIYIVTDSYYTKENLEKLLDKCGIFGVKEILDSCECMVDKRHGLFRKLKEVAGNQPVLHIGDDPEADICEAQKWGIDACQIYSGADLLEMCGYMGLWEVTDTLSDRLRTGMFVSVLFNSPFQFEGDKKICVYRAYDIGYLFFAPMISDFTFWLRQEVNAYDLKDILFCARDGYLIKKMYDEIADRTNTIYFLISRTAAIRAGTECAQDIRYVEEMRYSGSLQKELWERFGITVKAGKQKDGAGLLAYENEILEKAARCKKGYEAYIKKLNITEGTVAFFDFVAKGTSQMFVERLFHNDLKGFYFYQPEREQMQGKGLDICSFYQNCGQSGNAVFDNYYILETMLTAPVPTIKELDPQGNPVYAEETRTHEHIQCLLAAQNGIFDYFKDYLKYCPQSERKINKKLDEIMLSLIHRIRIQDRDFLDLKVEDPFFNRMTDVTDVI